MAIDPDADRRIIIAISAGRVTVDVGAPATRKIEAIYSDATEIVDQYSGEVFTTLPSLTVITADAVGILRDSAVAIVGGNSYSVIKIIASGFGWSTIDLTNA